MKTKIIKNMKFFIGLSFIQICIYAQPILNPSNLNPIGTANSYTINPSGFTAGSSGDNQTWNYSNLTLIPNGTVTTINQTTTPFINDFPGANYFLKNTNSGNETYEIFKLTSTKLEILGVTTNSNVLINFSPNPQTVFVFPYVYNSTIFDTYSTTNDPTADDPFTIKYDGYGTLITPFGAYNNVIRTKKMDGIFPIFSWYDSNTALKILSASFGSGGANLVIFQEYSNLSIIQEDLNNNIQIFPNPVIENFKISGFNNSFDNFTYAIFDTSAKLVKKGYAKYDDYINIKEIKSGIYFIQITNKDQNTVTKKIIKN